MPAATGSNDSYNPYCLHRSYSGPIQNIHNVLADFHANVQEEIKLFILGQYCNVAIPAPLWGLPKTRHISDGTFTERTAHKRTVHPPLHPTLQVGYCWINTVSPHPSARSAAQGNPRPIVVIVRTILRPYFYGTKTVQIKKPQVT